MSNQLMGGKAAPRFSWAGTVVLLAMAGVLAGCDASKAAEESKQPAPKLAPGQVQIIEGAASATLAALPSPDAVFLGGAVSNEVLDLCWAALRAGGRVVAHGVTLETEALLAERYRRHGGSLARLSLEIAEPLGRFHGWVPARPVTQWACRK